MSDDELLSRLKSKLDTIDITIRKMFGGIGIFSEKIMFSLIYGGVLYFRSNKELAAKYHRNSPRRHHPTRRRRHRQRRQFAAAAGRRSLRRYPPRGGAQPARGLRENRRTTVQTWKPRLPPTTAAQNFFTNLPSITGLKRFLPICPISARTLHGRSAMRSINLRTANTGFRTGSITALL